MRWRRAVDDPLVGPHRRMWRKGTEGGMGVGAPPHRQTLDSLADYVVPAVGVHDGAAAVRGVVVIVGWQCYLMPVGGVVGGGGIPP